MAEARAPESASERSAGERAAAGPAWTRRLKWRLEALGYDALAGLVRLLPVDAASGLGGFLGRLIGPRTRRHGVAEVNVRLAFPALTPEERQSILVGFWDNFGRSAIEFMLMDRLVPGSERVELVGAEQMRELKLSGAPAILISGHFGNFEVMGAAITHINPECRVVYRAANNPYTDARINAARRGYGWSNFAAKGGGNARELLRDLKRGGWLSLLSDQREDDGIEAPLFGHSVKSAVGPVRLALSVGGRFFPVSILRKGGANFRVTFHPPIELARTGDTARDLELGVARMNAFLESAIRANPSQWLWSHRRWPLGVYGSLNRKGRT